MKSLTLIFSNTLITLMISKLYTTVIGDFIVYYNTYFRGSDKQDPKSTSGNIIYFGNKSK